MRIPVHIAQLGTRCSYNFRLLSYYAWIMWHDALFVVMPEWLLSTLRDRTNKAIAMHRACVSFPRKCTLGRTDSEILQPSLAGVETAWPQFLCSLRLPVKESPDFVDQYPAKFGDDAWRL
jgi:hypothetical protein